MKNKEFKSFSFKFEAHDCFSIYIKEMTKEIKEQY